MEENIEMKEMMNYFYGRMRMVLSRDLKGVGTIEIILILCVLIAIVIVFKSQLTALVSDIFDGINSSAKKIY